MSVILALCAALAAQKGIHGPVDAQTFLRDSCRASARDFGRNNPRYVDGYDFDTVPGQKGEIIVIIVPKSDPQGCDLVAVQLDTATDQCEAIGYRSLGGIGG
jgi:hypothetical protein